MRAGACVLTWCLLAAVWPQSFFGDSFTVTINKLFAGDIFNGRGLWAAFVLLGVYWVWTGFRAARSHDDPVNGGSLLWSLAVIAFCIYALRQGSKYPFQSLTSFHLFCATWLGWMASNAANLWLQLRGVAGRREAPTIQEPRSSFFRFRRRVRIETVAEWYEEAQRYGNNSLALRGEDYAATPQLPPHVAPPEIVYVKQGDSFIPVQIPDARRVPVNRRLR